METSNWARTSAIITVVSSSYWTMMIYISRELSHRPGRILGLSYCLLVSQCHHYEKAVISNMVLLASTINIPLISTCLELLLLKLQKFLTNLTVLELSRLCKTSVVFCWSSPAMFSSQYQILPENEKFYLYPSFNEKKDVRA